MAFCRNCGASIPEGTKFCSSCGAPVGDASEPTRAAAPEAEHTSQNNQNYTVIGGYRANIKKRDIAVCVILSLVTCGIYGLIWFINIINDLNTAAQTPEDKSAGMIILLTIVTCGIYGWIWLYHAGEKVDNIRQRNGELPQSSSILYLILAALQLSIVVYCLIQSELNKVAAIE